MKSSREKLMLYALLGILALWQGVPFLYSLVFQPLTDRKNRIETLETGLEHKKVQERALKLASQRLKAWGQRSLPPDPLKAPQLYDTWLTNLALESKLTEVKLESDKNARKLEGDAYYAIKAKLTARGTLEHARDFIYAFHQAGFLHRVTKVSFDSSRNEPNRPMRLEFDVEALSLPNLPDRNTLMVDEASPPQPASPLKPRDDYAAIVEKNLFARGYNGPPKPVAVERTRPRTPVDELPGAAEFVYLTMSVTRGTARGAESDATLYDRSTNKETKLTPGISFEVSGLSGKVLSIGSAYVLLEIEGEPWRLELGENLKQLQKVSPPDSTIQ